MRLLIRFVLIFSDWDFKKESIFVLGFTFLSLHICLFSVKKIDIFSFLYKCINILTKEGKNTHNTDWKTVVEHPAEPTSSIGKANTLKGHIFLITKTRNGLKQVNNHGQTF